jgi:exopolyphosphatase/pppGpp-phosphohydrolase
MDMTYFSRHVMPAIIRSLSKAKELGVCKLYTVATAAYRNADNRTEIVEYIREKTGINVKILKKSEEAAATIMAFQFSTKYKESLQQSSSVLMIDQGGGSTEVSLYKNKHLIGSHSINLGTEILRNYLFQHNTGDVNLHQALTDTDRLIVERLKTFYKSDVGIWLNDHQGGTYCVAVGTAITKATGKSSNAEQHDYVMTETKINSVMNTIHDQLIDKYPNVESLFKVVDSQSYGYNDHVDARLTVRLGLKMFQRMMSQYNIPSITVSGTGLWYGIYFQELFGLTNN